MTFKEETESSEIDRVGTCYLKKLFIAEFSHVDLSSSVEEYL